MSPSPLLIAATTLLVASAAELRAQTATQTPLPPAPASATPSSGTLGLTLEEALRLAMQNNQALQDVRLFVESTDTGIGEQLGFFDPTYFATVGGGQTEQPTANRLQLGGDPFNPGPLVIGEVQSDSFNASTGFRQTLMNGLQYQASVNSDYAYIQPSPFSPLNPAVTSHAGISLTQPLLRGYGTTANKGALVEARNLSDITRLDLEQQMLETSFNVVRAYWDYVFTLTTLQTRREALAVAEDLLRINQRKKEAGVAIQLDVVTAESEVARRREELITAETTRGNAEDALRRAIFSFDDAGDWKESLVPLTQPTESAAVHEDWNLVAAEALEQRADVRSKMLDLKNRDIAIVLAKNATLPLLNLAASYGYNGIGSNFGNSYHPIEEQGFHEFTVALSLEVPIGNNAAAARLERAEIEKVRGLIQLRDLQNSVVLEVRSSLRDVESGAQRIAAAKEARRLAEDRYQSLLRRYDVGMAIVFEVREAQRDVFEARDQENRAVLDYQISLAGLQRARGALLKSYGLPTVPQRSRGDGIIYE